MKTTNPSRSRKHARILVASIAACAVLGLASSASAAFYNWHDTEHPPITTGNLWSGATNWTGAVPAAGDGFRIEQYGAETAGTGPIIMNVDYSGGALGAVQFFGAETVSIEQYFKTTHAKGVHMVNGGNGPAGSTVIVKSAANAILTGIAGTIDGHVTFESSATRQAPTVEFAGGSWVAGSGDLRYSNNEQNSIFKVTSASGSITPNKILVSDAPWQSTNPNRWPQIHFVLTATGVAPITLTQANPLDFQNAAAGTNPFKLAIDMASYTGPAAPIPLFIFSGTSSETDRMFASENITISNEPGAGSPWSVVQTDSGVTLTPAVLTQFLITSSSYDANNDQLTLTWNSGPGATYTIENATQFVGDGAGTSWDNLTTGIPSGGATTTKVIDAPSPGTYYRIRKE